jgi:anthranilate phosphoribosyltransferase
MIREAIAALVDGVELSREQARAVMNEIMSGECTDAQIGAFLTALRLKGETVGEIAGCAEVMREKATAIRAPGGCIDTCGTGGDSLHTFNISTAAALVAAGAGVTVAKHGNRSVSSTSGSADVLQALGVNVDAPPALVEQCLAEAGIGFLFAPRMHGAMKHAIGPRREMGIRTVFNILGPLTNPAGATRQLVGVYDAALAPVLAEVLGALGSERALVVHGHDGLDEISITGETTVAELDAGRVTTRTVTPEALGLERAPLAAIQVQSAEESAARIRGVLDGAHGPARAITLLNAGAAVYVAGRAGDMKEGVRVAREAVDSGAARTALDRLAALSARGA